MPPSPDSPVILQVLPSLVTGGVERGTVEIAQAIAEAEATSLVASAGGPLVRPIERAGGQAYHAAADDEEPVRHLAQRRARWRR